MVLRPLTAVDAAQIVTWRYPPPYDIYDCAELVPGPEFFAFDDDGELAGFASFGRDGQVPGGDYPPGPLDLGMGLHPARVGRGDGKRFLAAAIAFANAPLRATVAEFNTRALALCEHAGFRRVARFMGRERAFVILVLEDGKTAGTLVAP